VQRTRVRSRDRARRNVEALIKDFDRYVRRFEASNAFSGPSVYFHERAIERRRLHSSVADLLADERFLDRGSPRNHKPVIFAQVTESQAANLHAYVVMAYLRFPW
jgi:hypothetical protein